ncbi:MAG: carboxypeptidase regulatory-like domain-containing protein [Flavobacteriaceae bacterium]|nr:carboxypeptidase regulatory-like domain-containing protein [Flavobacteriaceae bacterium]
MKKITKLLMVMLCFVMTSAMYGQGVTTSSLNGKVLDNNGDPLPGANVVVIHTSSGTKYGSATDFDGLFRISNMRVGGPYTITISYIGFNDFVRSNVSLQLGQTFRVNATMVETANALEEVVITTQTNNIFDGNKTGTGITISQREIATIAAASRSIADFVRLTPQTQITEGNDGFSISISGQNNRFNSIYIDGAVNNDVFGLAGSGTNGGQTGVSPFSIDAIEQFQVNIAPFDVKISGFTGGAISAVTRSGNNNFEGSAYYFTRNESFAGKTPPDLAFGNERTRLGDFSAKTYGVRIGGPIVKDKLFFFVNYERQDEETPQPFNANSYIGDSDAAALTTLRNFVNTTYNYDIGNFDNALRTLVSDKITAKLDWNISDQHKLSLKHTYVQGDNLETRNSSARSLAFSNGSEAFLTKTNTSSLEWSFQGNKISNNLLLGYTQVRDDRDPSGNPFPSVFIGDGLNPFAFQGILFGAEPFSTANLLDQDVFTITNNFQIYKGVHTITIGTHNEFTKIKNLFFPYNYGRYMYNSIDEFITNAPAFRYERGYSLLSSGAGDTSSGAAEFNTKQFGLYFQDEAQVSDNVKISVGVRFDMPIWEDGAVNDDFNNRTIPLLEAEGIDLRGARVGKGLSNRVYLSPRAGFNWNVKGENKTQIRGGIGIFTSRLPFVWPAGTYNNNGITGGFAVIRNSAVFNPDVNNQPVDAVPGTGELGGNVDLFAPNFKLPQVVKYNLVIDQKLPWGVTASADIIYNDNLSAVYYEGLNIRGPVGSLNGADNRPVYSTSAIDRTYQRITLAYNTTKGNSWNTSFTLRKNFTATDKFKVYSLATYSYGDANVIFDATSSQNSSQWRNQQSVNGKNSALPVTRSDFSQGHRVFTNSSFEFNWSDNLKTTLGFFYDGTQGRPFSYIYGSSDRSRLLGDDSRDNALFYVPANASEINLIDLDNGGTIITAAEQWTALDNYIESNEYLRERRGQYTERNGDRGRWSHVVDLKFIQDFSINAFGKKQTLQFTADIYNFTNLINKDWGKRYFTRNVTIVNVENGRGDINPEFNFDPNRTVVTNQLDDRGIQSSRWQMQIGLRYLFN